MQFNSVAFVFFFLPLVILVFRFLKEKSYKRIWLVFTSVIFYLLAQKHGIEFLIIYAVINFFILKILITKRSRFLLACGISLDVIALLIYRYTNFAEGICNRVLHTSFQPVHWLVPLGISLITFSAISLLVDVYKDKVKSINFTDYFLYLSFFPKVGEGPITRYSEIAEAVKTGGSFSFPLFVKGLKRFSVGLAKKCIIADILGQSVDLVFAHFNQGVPVSAAWLVTVCYTFQIYCDFSGYTDMAIGIGNMLGFPLPENFNFPYLSHSISEFWGRWHITLGHWFRDYVYIPLGGNRCSRERNVFNLIIVWLLTGLWHGPAMHFIFWGGYHGFFVIIEKFLKNKHWYQNIPGWIKILCTFFIVNLGWLFFRAENFHQIVIAVKTMFGLYKPVQVFYGFEYYFSPSVLLMLGIAILFSLPRPRFIQGIIDKNTTAYILYDLSIAVIFAAAVWFMINSTYSAFIYFQF